MSAPANGRTATRSDREVPAQRSTGAHGAPLERLAEHLEGAAAAVRALARDLDIQLADLAGESDLFVVPTTTPGPELLTVEDVAALLKAEPKSVRRWERDGLLPKAIRPCGQVRWRAGTIHAWLEEQGS